MNACSVLFAVADSPPQLTFQEFYATNLRLGLFSGFLTLSGFLLAMKTLVVIQLRKELYDTKHYRLKVAEWRKLSPKLPVYAPLRRFGRLLLAAVCMSLVTAVSQLSVGLVPDGRAAATCVTLAAITILFVLAALYVLWQNLGDLFAFWEEEAAEKMKQEGAPTSTTPGGS